MTVGQMIRFLQTFDKHMDVRIECGHYDDDQLEDGDVHPHGDSADAVVMGAKFQ